MDQNSTTTNRLHSAAKKFILVIILLVSINISFIYFDLMLKNKSFLLVILSAILFVLNFTFIFFYLSYYLSLLIVKTFKINEHWNCLVFCGTKIVFMIIAMVCIAFVLCIHIVNNSVVPNNLPEILCTQVITIQLLVMIDTYIICSKPTCLVLTDSWTLIELHVFL